MKKITQKTKIRVNPKIIDKKIDGKTYLFDPKKGKMYFLNQTASLIWKLAKKECRMGEIVSTVVEEFAIRKRTASKDIREFTSESLKNELIKISG